MNLEAQRVLAFVLALWGLLTLWSAGQHGKAGEVEGAAVFAAVSLASFVLTFIVWRSKPGEGKDGQT